MPKKKIGVQLSAILLALVVSGGVAHAQKGTRINFKRGASSASVSGSLRPGGNRKYVMRVKTAQQINAVVFGKGVSLDNGIDDDLQRPERR